MINIYDYETLGQDVTKCPVVSVAAMTVDEGRFAENPYTYEELVSLAKYMKFDVKEQVEKYNRVIEKSTIEWWSQQGEAAMDQIKPSKYDVSIADLVPFLRSVFTDKEPVYTRGNTFDPIMTTTLCNLLNEKEPYDWWDIRDTRSFIEGIGLATGEMIRSNFVPEEVAAKFVAHDPRHDIAMDIYRIQSLVKSL